MVASCLSHRKDDLSFEWTSACCGIEVLTVDYVNFFNIVIYWQLSMPKQCNVVQSVYFLSPTEGLRQPVCFLKLTGFTAAKFWRKGFLCRCFSIERLACCQLHCCMYMKLNMHAEISFRMWNSVSTVDCIDHEPDLIFFPGLYPCTSCLLLVVDMCVMMS